MLYCVLLVTLLLPWQVLAQPVPGKDSASDVRKATIELNLCRLQLNQTSRQMASELTEALERAERAEALVKVQAKPPEPPKPVEEGK